MPNLELEKRHVLQLLALIAPSAIDVTMDTTWAPTVTLFCTKVSNAAKTTTFKVAVNP